MSTVTFNKDEIVFHQGDFAEGMFDIIAGSIGVFVGYGTDNEKQLTVLKSGDFLGEMGLIENYPRSATAVARAPAGHHASAQPAPARADGRL